MLLWSIFVSLFWLLQSRASCFSAHALCPQSTWKIVDATAAPGNKTSHLAAMVDEKLGGRVIAVDRDPGRFKVLQKTLTSACVASKVNARCADFLQMRADRDKSLRGVDAILLDPSCSGSGTSLSRRDNLLDDRNQGEDAERLARLASFQLAALKHALNYFPSCRRIVYSTCSIHPIENESVVSKALSLAHSRGYRLALPSESPLRSWPRRGQRGHGLSDEDAAQCLRVDAKEDQTDGFFVAVFERDADHQEGGTLGSPPHPPGAPGAQLSGGASAAPRRRERRRNQRKYIFRESMLTLQSFGIGGRSLKRIFTLIEH